jgi:hypothetical protein
MCAFAYAVMGVAFGCGHLVLCLMLTFEASTPFLNAIHWLSAKIRTPKVRRQLGFAKRAFFVAFMAVRMIWQPYLIYTVAAPQIYQDWNVLVQHSIPQTDTGINVFPARVAAIELAASMALNTYWAYLLIHKALGLGCQGVGSRMRARTA